MAMSRDKNKDYLVEIFSENGFSSSFIMLKSQL